MHLFLKSLLTVAILLTSLASLPTSDQEERMKIVFFGDSLTAGYGLTMQDAFPHIIQQRIDSLGLPYEVVNAGLSGETTAGGINRIDWILKSKPDIFILELGANDGLRGLSPDQTKKNLSGMIDKVKASNPEAVILLAGMQMFPNMGQEYTEQFREAFPLVAKEKDVKLIPFILEGVGGDESLNQSDGIHPNIEGHKIVAETVWYYIKPYLKSAP
ncbi:MAG: arylesterase [Roseivirga sp.]